MHASRPISAKCFFVAWIFCWVTAIYVPSALLTLLDLSPLAEGKSLFDGTFAVADEVAPAAKMGFALSFASLALAVRRYAPLPGLVMLATDMLLACLAMLLVLAALPEDWSRGFGIGLTGTRFAPRATLIYVGSALLSGLVFSISEARCSLQAASKPSPE